MSKTKVYQQNHSTYICKYHIVWTTKWRKQIMKDKWVKEEMRRIIRVICKWKGFVIQSWHIGDEHIHLYLTIPPKYSISYVMSVLKGKTSKWIKKKTSKVGEGSIWSKGYFVSTIGLNEESIRRYIENQDRPKVKDVQVSMLQQA